MESQAQRTQNQEQMNSASETVSYQRGQFVKFCAFWALILLTSIYIVTLIIRTTTDAQLSSQIADLQSRIETIAASQDVIESIMSFEGELSDSRYLEYVTGLQTLENQMNSLNKRMDLVEIWTSKSPSGKHYKRFKEIVEKEH